MKPHWTTALLALSLAAATTTRAELALIDSGFSGFEYAFSGFGSSVAATGGARVWDPLDDSGGVGFSLGGADLSAYAAGRFVAEFTNLPGSEIDRFSLQLVDSAGNSAYWPLLTTGAAAGERQTVVSHQTLGGAAGLDLTSIDRFQVLGSYTNPIPLDLEIASVVVSNEAAAPAPYFGHEADAPWRVAAAERIDAVRKADLGVRVVDAIGQPIRNASVRVAQTGHEFGFGTAVQARRLVSDTPDNEVYKQKVLELFNRATLENGLKWPAWQGEWGPGFTPDVTSGAVDWLEGQGLPIRGHNMVWPGYDHAPAQVRALLDSGPLDSAGQAQLRSLIFARIAEIGGEFAGRFESWDVVNEPRTQRDFMQVLPEGDSAMAGWFHLAKAIDPGATMVLNEYGILSSGGEINGVNHRYLEGQIAALQAAGAPVGAVGLQGHFHEDSLTGPEQLWRVFDRYAATGVDIQVTEYDFVTRDETLQAEYLRDFFTAAFAHESVTEVSQWGFWEEAHWRPDGALFRSDWSAKPAAEAYRDLVFDEWWTDETLPADEAGEAVVRGFKGDYEVTVTWAGRTYTVAAELSDDGQSLEVALPILLGDFNGDGVVDIYDRYWLRRTLDGPPRFPSQVGYGYGQPGAGADGNGDGVVDLEDQRVWFAARDAYAAAQSGQTVPEPAAFGLALLAVLAPFTRGR